MYNIAMNKNRPLNNEKTYQFGGWHFNPIDGQLISSQKSIRLQPRLARLLSILVTNPNTLLTRNELIDAVWQEKTVNEDALSRCIAELRSVFGDSSSKPTYIETVPKKGYRFIHTINTGEPETEQLLDKSEMAMSNLARFSAKKLGLFTFLLLVSIFVYYQVPQTQNDQTVSSSDLKTGLISAKRLTTDSNLERHPELSNKGELVAFSTAKDRQLIIKIINTKGELVYEIKDPDHHLISATFSPDDKKLLITAVNKPSCHIYLYQLPSLKREKITNCDSSGESSIVDWSPDANSFAFVYKGAVAEQKGYSYSTAIWEYSFKTKQQKQLTYPALSGNYDTRPHYSNDGRLLGFTRGTSSIRNVFMTRLINRDESSGVTKLTNGKAYITSFNWLDNNHQFVYDSDELGDRNLWLFDINSRKKELLGARDAKFPSLSNNNNKLIYQEVRYNANIWQVDLEDRQEKINLKDHKPKPIIQSIKYNNFPTYSPDGKIIAFVSNRQGKGAIWLYSPETKQQTKLIAIPKVDIVLPSWSNDGKKILVSSHGPDGYRCYQINVSTGQYEPLYSMEQQHHECQYSAQGDIFVILKESNQKTILLKLTKDKQIEKLTDFGVARVQPTQQNTLIYSLPEKVGLYSMDFSGMNSKTILKDFNYQLDEYWTVQGNYLYYPKLRQDRGIWRRHLLTGKETKVTAVLPSAIGLNLNISPDHKQVIYSQTDDRQADIYLATLQDPEN